MPNKYPPELATQASGRQPRNRMLASLTRLLGSWTGRSRRPAVGTVIIAGDDAPRDLDDPLGDSAVQARVGATIARLTRRNK